MQIKYKDLKDKLIYEFNFHDAKILNIQENGKYTVLILKDGFVPGQINELCFLNANISSSSSLENRYIYQLENLVRLDEFDWHMSLLIWTDELDSEELERVDIHAKNIICKKYKHKNSLEAEEDLNEALKNK